MLGVIFASAILAAATPAAAAKPPAQASDRIICRTINQPGSRLSTRTCLTAEVWRERGQEDRKDLNGSQRGPQVMPMR